MIGKIEKVKLREIWKHEALDFTTWLVNNIDVLNAVLDFQISNPVKEKSTGNFNVDIVGEDENGVPVIIENQLEKSDHDHLGKLITYLAAIGAGKAIWIVSEPRQEHIKAISWLNEAMSAEFYLFKIEGVKIGESHPAPLFTLIVGPSAEVREAGETKKEYAERHHLRKQFWTDLFEISKKKTKLHANNTPNIRSYAVTSSGVSGLSYNYAIGQHDAQVELYIDRNKDGGIENKKIFDKLSSNKNQIEKLFGSKLSWERLDNKRASRVAKRYEFGYKDENKRTELCNQMVDDMIKLENVLAPFIADFK